MRVGSGREKRQRERLEGQSQRVRSGRLKKKKKNQTTVSPFVFCARVRCPLGTHAHAHPARHMAKKGARTRLAANNARLLKLGGLVLVSVVR